MSDSELAVVDAWLGCRVNCGEITASPDETVFSEPGFDGGRE